MPPTYTHPPPLPFLSALSTPNTKDQHLFLLLRRNHSFRRIQDSWPPGPFRCPVCVCACLPVFICVLVDLFCPPPTTTATVLPIPHPIDTSSPCFAKCVSSGNVCGNVHKTASVGLAWAKNTTEVPPPMPEPPPPPPDHACFVFERFRRRKTEFPPYDHIFTCEISSGRP